MSLDSKYQDALGKLPSVASFKEVSLPSGPFDFRLELETTSGPQVLLVEVHRSHLTRTTVSRVQLAAPKHAEPVLVVAPYIGVQLAEELVRAGLHYLDARGNCHIDIPSYFVHIEGKKGPAKPAAAKGLRAAGYQVLFAYLAEPRLLNATLDQVAEAAGVSRQPVTDMRRRLVDEGYVLKTKSRLLWAPRRQQDGLALWLHGYETMVRPSLLWGTYRTQEQDVEALEAKLEQLLPAIVSDYRWGGCAGGVRLAGHYRGARTVVHVHSTPGDFRNKVRAANDPRGNLAMMNAFGSINWTYGPTGATAHPLLVYSEMLAEGSERAREAAQLVYEQHLAPIWENDR